MSPVRPRFGYRCALCGELGATCYGLLAYCATPTCARAGTLRCLSPRGWVRVGGSGGGLA